MEFTMFGFDVYASEVDDKGIDFVIRKHDDLHKDEAHYYDVQVKSSRKSASGFNYIFFQKEKFSLRANLLAAIVLFQDGQMPMLYLIPSTEWNKPNPLLRSKDYIGKKSKPEWGLNLSEKNLCLLDPFAFDKVIESL